MKSYIMLLLVVRFGRRSLVWPALKRVVLFAQQRSHHIRPPLLIGHLACSSIVEATNPHPGHPSSTFALLLMPHRISYLSLQALCQGFPDEDITICSPSCTDMQHSGQTPCFGGGGGGGTINVALYVAGSAAGSAGIACPAFCFVIFFRQLLKMLQRIQLVVLLALLVLLLVLLLVVQLVLQLDVQPVSHKGCKPHGFLPQKQHLLLLKNNIPRVRSANVPFQWKPLKAF